MGEVTILTLPVMVRDEDGGELLPPSPSKKLRALADIETHSKSVQP